MFRKAAESVSSCCEQDRLTECVLTTYENAHRKEANISLSVCFTLIFSKNPIPLELHFLSHYNAPAAHTTKGGISFLSHKELGIVRRNTVV